MLLMHPFNETEKEFEQYTGTGLFLWTWANAFMVLLEVKHSITTKSLIGIAKVQDPWPDFVT